MSEQQASTDPAHPAASVSRHHGIASFRRDLESALPANGSAATVPAVARHRRLLRNHTVNLRLALVRLLGSGLTALLTVVITPGLRFTDPTWWRLLVIALLFGLLNAVVKPILQFFVLRYIVSTYGAVVVLINMLLLWLMDELSDGFIAINGVFPLVIGGVLLGLLGLIIDTLLGANPPMLDSRFDSEDAGS